MRWSPVLLALALLALAPRPAHALYIDPTIGSTVLQVLAAAVLGALYATRQSWHRVRASARRLWRRLTGR
jgi:hypothetical protein